MGDKKTSNWPCLHIADAKISAIYRYAGYSLTTGLCLNDNVSCHICQNYTGGFIEVNELVLF